jgi:hypothetical protein
MSRRSVQPETDFRVVRNGQARVAPKAAAAARNSRRVIEAGMGLLLSVGRTPISTVNVNVRDSISLFRSVFAHNFIQLGKITVNYQ